MIKIKYPFHLGFIFSSIFFISDAKASLPFADLIKQCSVSVPADVMGAILLTESAKNPYAIGVVKGYVKQPKSRNEAIKTAYQLQEQGKNFSMGLVQINKHNLKNYGLNFESVFDPCLNIKAGSLILLDCYNRARKKSSSINQSWEKAFSCYYSGNFSTGFKRDFANQPPYVTKVVNNLIQLQGGRGNSENIKTASYNKELVAGDFIELPKIKNYLANHNPIKQNITSDYSENISTDDSENISTDDYSIVNKTNQDWDVFNNPKSNIF